MRLPVAALAFALGCTATPVVATGGGHLHSSGSSSTHSPSGAHSSHSSHSGTASHSGGSHSGSASHGGGYHASSGSHSGGTHSSSSHPASGSHSSSSHSSSHSHSSSSHSATGSHNKAPPWVHRDSHGKIARDPRQTEAFKKQHPCPATGKTYGPCHGYVIDHVIPLKRGGPDSPSNMQWQTTAAAKEKDKWE